ncbi:unnamed protein product [Mytilus edulis]|uniref:Uncharacterized protein n=1 Tax=Mytilus edulis TaxID=6550 RepID=A0A8S3TTW3_MYTED|nr:unnamed protein product [Mytilus edulis]
MSLTEDIKFLSDIIFVLPQRVRVVEAVRDLPFAEGDILVLELVKNLDLVEGIDRVTEDKIRIPLDYHGKVVLDEEETLKEIVDDFGLQNIVIKDEYEHPSEFEVVLGIFKNENETFRSKEEYVPDIPPRLTKSSVSRQSLMSNQSGASSGPVRPDRRRRTISIQSEDIPKPFERLVS